MELFFRFLFLSRRDRVCVSLTRALFLFAFRFYFFDEVFTESLVQ